MMDTINVMAGTTTCWDNEVILTDEGADAYTPCSSATFRAELKGGMGAADRLWWRDLCMKNQKSGLRIG